MNGDEFTSKQLKFLENESISIHPEKNTLTNTTNSLPSN